MAARSLPHDRVALDPRSAGRHHVHSGVAIAWAAALLTTLSLALPAAAESVLLVQVPRMLEAIGATTFDDRGRAIGHSSFDVETRPDGTRRMRVTMAVEDGGTNVSQATLAPITGRAVESSGEGGPALRLIEERSQSTAADGRTFPLLVIDHARGRISCYPADEPESAGRHVEIEKEDRIVNVAIQFFLLPLVHGGIDSLRFQIATCAEGPVVHRMVAMRGPTIERGGRQIVEIEYRPDFGDAIAWLAGRLLPSFSFWFDASDGTYLGHRMPLHRKGPEVTLVRQGLTPPQIGIE